MPYARSYQWKINIEIPQNYSPKGLDILNYDIENELGVFKSKAEIEKKQLVINIFKVYKSNFANKNDWSKMVEFLEAAFNFTQKKILLKRLN